jgi:hypothetical protein
MRLELTVNDGSPVRASLQSKGWLSAHLNLDIEPESEKTSGKVFLDSIDTSDEPNAVHSTWDVGNLAVGDRIQVRVLDDGEADPPTKIRRTSESPKNLFFQETETARALLSAIRSFDIALGEVLDRARVGEPEEEFKRIANAILKVSCEMDQRLIMPTLRRHPDLVEEAKKMGIYK